MTPTGNRALLERVAIRVQDRSLLGWLFVIALAAGTIYFGVGVAAGMHKKWNDPEWRRLADKWTWIGMTLGTLIMFGVLSFVLFSCFATAVVWLRA